MTRADTTSDGPLAGVVGQPVTQSLSPVIHGTWLDRFGLPGRYVAREIGKSAFEVGARALLEEEGWVGMNVTVPHKEAAFAFCDTLDSAAKRLSAVNTIVRNGDGTIEGRNTDLQGFRANLEQAAGWRGAGAGPAVVLGAGGAARAVVAALQDLGFTEIRVLNRTVARAEALAADLDMPNSLIRPLDLTPEALDGADLLVNTTSLGMTGQPPLDLDLAALPETAFVTDIVYKPIETDLLARARARGNPTVDGLGMLLHQAVPGFVAWFRPPEPPTVDEALRATVLRAMGA